MCTTVPRCPKGKWFRNIQSNKFLFDQGKETKVKRVMIVMIVVVYTLKGKLFRNTGIVISEQSNMHDMSAYHQHSYLSRRQSLIPQYYNLSIKIFIFVFLTKNYICLIPPHYILSITKFLFVFMKRIIFAVIKIIHIPIYKQKS